MALSEDEEYELLKLERERATAQKPGRSFDDRLQGAADTVKKVEGVIMNNPVTQRILKQGQVSQTPQLPGSPQEMLGRVQPALSQGAEKVGDFIAPELARRGIDPTAAAAAGTLTGMAPDIAATVANPVAGEYTPPKAAVGWMRRALGFQNAELKTPFARNQAASAAKEAFAENIMPRSGNPRKAFDRVQQLKTRSGKALEGMRDSVGPQPVDRVLDQLETLRDQATEGGARGGAWDAVHAKIDDAKETIKGLYNSRKNDPIYTADIQIPESPGETLPSTARRAPGPDVIDMKQTDRVSPNSVEAGKKREGGGINWLADLNSQTDSKGISNAIEKGVENILADNGVDMNAYRVAKRKYSAAKSMEKGLNKEIAGQEGNNSVSLRGAAIGAGALAHGNPVPAMAQIGLWEAARRRGSAVLAHNLNWAGKQVEGVKRALPGAMTVGLDNLGQIRRRTKEKKK